MQEIRNAFQVVDHTVRCSCLYQRRQDYTEHNQNAIHLWGVGGEYKRHNFSYLRYRVLRPLAAGVPSTA